MRTPKKLTALILMGALTASSIAAVPASAKTFSDVPSNHWAYKVIDEVSNEGIMIGTGTGIFSPNTQLTRAEYTAILYNFAPDKSNGIGYKYSLNDVNDDDWFADAAEWGVSNGIIKEVGDDFKPNDPVTREIMAEMTYRYILKYIPNYLDIDVSSAGYSDESTFSDRYTQAINVLTNNGLLAGREGNAFKPQGTLTRAEAAAMASRILEVEDQAGVSDPEDPENPPIDSEEPPVVPEEPEQGWSLDGAPEWFLIGQPDYLSDDEWNELITYWRDKERPAEYPSKLSSSITTEEQAWRDLNYYMGRLQDIMKKNVTIEKTIQALEADSDAYTLTSEEQAMVDAINHARIENGSPTLKISPALCKAAEIRAEEILKLFEHERPDGRKTQTVLNEVGLADFNGKTYGGNSEVANLHYGENITYMPNSTNYPCDQAFNAFMNSSGHRQNLLNDKYTYIGVAKYSDGVETSWVQVFVDSALF